jgi:hypothetical protein
MLIALKNTVRSATYCWDNEKHCFYNRYTDKDFISADECFYAYVGYVPSGYTVYTPIVCEMNSCPHYDNGYCLGYNTTSEKCEYGQVVNEYSVEQKRIWKEFEK